MSNAFWFAAGILFACISYVSHAIALGLRAERREKQARAEFTRAATEAIARAEVFAVDRKPMVTWADVARADKPVVLN
jgi:hypothetical protein